MRYDRCGFPTDVPSGDAKRNCDHSDETSFQPAAAVADWTSPGLEWHLDSASARRPALLDSTSTAVA